MTAPDVAALAAALRDTDAPLDRGPTTYAEAIIAALAAQGWALFEKYDPESSEDSRQPYIPDDHVSAQEAPGLPRGMTREEFTPYWQGRLDAAVKAALEGLRAEVEADLAPGDKWDPDDPQGRQMAETWCDMALAIIDDRLAALDA